MDKDIIICDWHYGDHPAYPSIDYFVKKVFKVLGCPSVYSMNNITDFTNYVRSKCPSEQLPGMIMTYWGKMCRLSEVKEDKKAEENNWMRDCIDDSKIPEAILLAGQCFRE